MIRRRSFALVAFTAVAALALAGRAHASGIANYEIVNTSPKGTKAVTEIDAEIQPPGAVYAPTNSTTSPMTVLSGSSGFNASDLTFKLGNNQSGQNVALGFVFDPATGFAPGGVLNFSLQTTGSAPDITLIDPTTGKAPVGLTLSSYTPPPPPPPPTAPPTVGSGAPTGHTSTPGAQVPEPVSIAVWSVAAGLGLFRARAFRRARAIAG